jgi:hypothetical protein
MIKAVDILLFLATMQLGYMLYTKETLLAGCERISHIASYLEDSLRLHDRAKELGLPQCDEIYAWMPEQLARARQGIADSCPPNAIVWFSMLLIRAAKKIMSLFIV